MKQCQILRCSSDDTTTKDTSLSGVVVLNEEIAQSQIRHSYLSPWPTEAYVSNLLERCSGVKNKIP